MRLRRIGLALAVACAGFANACVQATEVFKGFSSRWSPCVWTQPPRHKSKLNKVSQAKRRKYKRQGRE